MWGVAYKFVTILNQIDKYVNESLLEKLKNYNCVVVLILADVGLNLHNCICDIDYIVFVWSQYDGENIEQRTIG